MKVKVISPLFPHGMLFEISRITKTMIVIEYQGGERTLRRNNGEIHDTRHPYAAFCYIEGLELQRIEN